MINIVAAATFIFSVLFATLCYFLIGPNSALSSVVGSAVMLVNLFGIWFAWKLVFLKKSIALAVVIIVIKYVILGLFLWNFAKYKWLQPVGFIIGLSTLLFGLVSSIFLKKDKPHAF